ncbi:SRPBCC family protein [Chelativorans salis]|uniref:SRPBCC domain-containing protein n=1 Tax=Chelativorans salis TaxID=2978478 RepID=A0ABT2LLR4_9HYPH|nr:SRPBCC domain-containing protein [Chelativorans sp. EGI FJ00035]MCT7374119.1 SRPBCC domain-containing protein [Chelativorans sp. EGI FJ00035]
MTTSDSPTIEASVTAHADFTRGEVSASALLPAMPDRVFRAMTSAEICQWWVHPGVFDTREWNGDLRVGGRWESAGIGGGQPYRLKGEYLEVEPPVRLAHTWKMVGEAGDPSTVTYRVEPEGDSVRLTVDHAGLVVEEICEATRAGWETSLTRLAEILAEERRQLPRGL